MHTVTVPARPRSLSLDGYRRVTIRTFLAKAAQATGLKFNRVVSGFRVLNKMHT